jgi:hypothetical protein
MYTQNWVGYHRGNLSDLQFGVSQFCLSWMSVSCREIWRSNSYILLLAEASEQDQGPRRTVEPVMMMMDISYPNQGI